MPRTSTRNGGLLPLERIPRLTIEDFRAAILDGVRDGARIACLTATPLPEGPMALLAVLAWQETGTLSVAFAKVDDRFPSLATDCPQAHLFEREIAEQWRILPVGHPWLKPVRFQPPRGEAQSGPTDQSARPACGIVDYFQVAGEEVHEVAVGPVHAGIIEPGHFRFQCHGETVHHLEISLGYQHRGVERALVGGPGPRTLHYMETLAGDTTVGHASAYCRAMETLADVRVPARAHGIRAIAEELERVANHIGDLGALAGDIGFLPTQSYCGRIRGDVLNMTAAICGNRFGRGLVRPGGTGFDLDPALVKTLMERGETVMRDATSAINLLWNTPSVLARFEGTGTVSLATGRAIGLVGVAARACGLRIDVRRDFPYGIYNFAHVPVASCDSGDVFARALVRWQEIQRSMAFVHDQLEALPTGTVLNAVPALRPQSMTATLVEGWRGEICHVALTDEQGRLANYKIVDPSFHNWFGLACALREEQISDFPLCNKSFNLSYCGHDL